MVPCTDIKFTVDRGEGHLDHLEASVDAGPSSGYCVDELVGLRSVNQGLCWSRHPSRSYQHHCVVDG